MMFHAPIDPATATACDDGPGPAPAGRTPRDRTLHDLAPHDLAPRDLILHDLPAREDRPLREQLALLAAGLDTRFVRVGETLATAIDTIDRVIAGLDGVAAALSPDTAGVAVASLRRVAAQLADLPAAQAHRAGHAATVADTAATLRGHVMDMHEMLRVLNIYGMNIKIAASGEGQFFRFVDGMKVKLALGETELDAFLAVLKELAAGVAATQQSDRLLAAEYEKVVPHVPEKLAADATGLERHLGRVADMARRVGAIARGVQGQVAVVLGALQVGDSTRQRIEHVVSALQMVQSHPDGADGGPALGAGGIAHIDRLLAAQLDAVADDFARETRALLDSLGRIGPSTADLLALIEDQGGAEGRAFLNQLERGISDVDRVTTQLREAEARSMAMTAFIAGTVGDLTTRLKSVQRIAVDVQDISTNTRLLCRRHGTVGKAVSVVATEVDSYAVRLREVTRNVAAAIEALAGVNTVMQDAAAARDGGDMGEVLAAALGVIRQACQRSDDVAMKGGDDARQLIGMLADTGHDLDPGTPLADTLAAAAATLIDHAGDAGPPDVEKGDAEEGGAEEGSAGSGDAEEGDAAALHALMPRINALYTMAAERDLHARFLLPGMATPTPPPAADDDDDDGLF